MQSKTKKSMTNDFSHHEQKYLHLLSKQFPTAASAATEIINLKLYLNFKQLAVARKTMKCQGCQMEKGENSLVIRIHGGDNRTMVCDENQCMVLCCWMMRKHDWLVKELGALKEYLFSVNNSLFKTEINFVINYRDDMKLDVDMFDSVQDYLDA